jgi:hypothetical protein
VDDGLMLQLLAEAIDLAAGFDLALHFHDVFPSICVMCNRLSGHHGRTETHSAVFLSYRSAI